MTNHDPLEPARELAERQLDVSCIADSNRQQVTRFLAQLR